MESEVTHANQLRGQRFRALVGSTKTWVILLAVALAVAVVGFLIAPFVGGAAFAAAIIIGLLVVLAIADSQAEDAFYDSFARSRGLVRQGSGQLDACTPLLRKGDSRRAAQIFTGPLADDFEGTLALYTYTVEDTDSDGNRTETNYPFTLILVDLPETVDHMPELRAQNKSGFKALEKFEDVFRRKHERVTLESEDLRDRYEIFVSKDQDPNWVRQLFSPSFIVWLTEAPPKRFAFELERGKLCAFVPKHKDNTEDFDEVIAAGCRVAARLREEANE